MGDGWYLRAFPVWFARRGNYGPLLSQAKALAADSSRVPVADPTRSVLAWTELTLTDLGAHAKPEITQQPELPPDLENSEIDPSGFQE